MVSLHLEANTVEELRNQLWDSCIQFGLIKNQKETLAISICMKNMSFIDTIKEYRAITKSTLKEAKEEIEKARALLEHSEDKSE